MSLSSSLYAQDYYAQDDYPQNDVCWPTFVDQDNLIQPYHLFLIIIQLQSQFPLLPSKQRRFDLEWVERILGEFTRRCSEYPHPDTFKLKCRHSTKQQQQQQQQHRQHQNQNGMNMFKPEMILIGYSNHQHY